MNKTVIRVMSLAAFMAAFALCSLAQLPRPEPKQTPPVQPNPQPIEPAALPCPTVELRSQTQQPIRDGRPVKFTASVTGADPKISPIFSWSTTAGVITQGQGTPTIDVDSTGAGADKAITASLLIGGFPPECVANSTITIPVAGPAKKLDEYGTLKEDEENPRLDGFIANVTPSELAYIIVYAGRTSRRGQATIELRRIRAYLVKAGTPSERIVTLDGGYREDLTHELWYVPVGAEPPRPSPTINAKDIVFPKPTPTPVKKP